MLQRLFAKPPPAIWAGVLVFLVAFSLYSLTTSTLTSYEDETGAVTEALVLKGQIWEIDNSPLKAQGIPGRDGHLYSRTGLLQPLLEAPFYAVGHFLDANFRSPQSFPLRQAFLWFYNPFVAALAAVALFAIVLMTRRSIPWAVATAMLFTFASIAWPYSKIGSETTFMFAIMTTFALAIWARRKPTTVSWALTGFAAGAAAASKGYSIVALLSLPVLLWPTFMKLSNRDRVRLALALCLPIAVWCGAIGWYNWARFGSPTNSGYSNFAPSLTMPINVFGLLFSPGKGLVLYSPLVILGALGIPRLWRQDRSLAAALLTLFASVAVIGGASSFWGDEVWGPRYLAPVAWTLLVPIAWWADSTLRRRVLIGVASLGVLVQMVGVAAPYYYYQSFVRDLTGVKIYEGRLGINPDHLPYGDDPPRWIPELSALVLQTEGLISTQVVDRLGGHGITVTYQPLEGRGRSLNLSDPSVRLPVDFWWHRTINKLGAHIAALFMFLTLILSGTALYRLCAKRKVPLSKAA